MSGKEGDNHGREAVRARVRWEAQKEGGAEERRGR